MAMILGGIAAAVIAARALWDKLTGNNPTVELMMSRKVKLGTNLIVVAAQAVGYIAEILGGTRTTTPGTTSTTAGVAGGDKPSESAEHARLAKHFSASNGLAGATS
jgi:hypothetical protein